MLRVVEVFPIGTMLSVTLEGDCESIHVGSRLHDPNGNQMIVDSVAMIAHDNPMDIRKSITILVAPCSLAKGTELFICSTNENCCV